MSSDTYIKPKPPPPPPPRIVEQSGQTRIDLRKMFGRTVEKQLSTTLEELDEDFDGFCRQELGVLPTSSQAKRLRWRQTGQGQGKTREYTMSLQGTQLPAELREGSGGRLNVRLMIGGGPLRVEHDYLAKVPGARAAEVERNLRPALERAVARAANPLIAAAISQGLKQKAQQVLEHRLKQQRLRTRMTESLNIQTTGLVQTVRSV